MENRTSADDRSETEIRTLVVAVPVATSVDGHAGPPPDSRPAPPPAELTDVMPAQPVARSAVLAVGTTIGRYVVLGMLGRGNGGAVYSAYDATLDRKVALKVLHAASVADQQMLIWEAQAMAKLSHPNVVAVHDVGRVDDTRLYLAMEMIEGSSARTWMASKRRSWREVVDIYRQAGAGLEAAHRAGIIHRDFKPDNVLVASDGRALVTDFGVAKPAGGSAPATGDGADDADLVTSTRVVSPPRAPEIGSGSEPRHPAPVPTSTRNRAAPLLASTTLFDTRMGKLVGTTPYLSPERMKGLPSDPLSDEFAFAVSLYEGLYDARPFDHRLASSAPTRWRVAEPPAESNVPSWLRKVVVRGLAVDPAERYPDVAALLVALRRDPRQRRRAVAAMVLGAAALAVVVALSRTPARADPCAAAGDDWATVWDAAARGRVAAAFAASRHTNQAASFAGTDRALATYTHAGAAESLRACRDTRISGIQSDEALSLRSTCLGRSRTQARALVGVLGSANAELVARATSASYELPDLAGCDDLVSLRSPVALPTSPVERALIGELGREMSEARALYSAGHSETGERSASHVVSEARRIGYAPLEAEGLLMLGRMKATIGGNEAMPLLERALFVAEQAHALELKFNAATELVLVYRNLTQSAKVVLVAGLARSYFVALGLPSRLKAQLLSLESSVQRTAGDLAGSVVTIRAAVAADAEDGAKNPVTTSRLLNLLGNAQADLGDLPAALVSSRAALALRERLFGVDSMEAATGHMNLAAMLNQIEHYAEAQVDAAQADAVAARHGADQIGIRWYTLMNLGETELGLGLTTSAERKLATVAREATAAGNQIGDVAMRTQARCLVALGRAREAVPLATRALERFDARMGVHDPERISFLLDLARARRAVGDHAGARTLLDAATALAAETQIATTDATMIALELGRTAEASGAPRVVVERHLTTALELARRTGQVVTIAAIERWRAGGPLIGP